MNRLIVTLSTALLLSIMFGCSSGGQESASNADHQDTAKILLFGTEDGTSMFIPCSRIKRTEDDIFIVAVLMLKNEQEKEHYVSSLKKETSGTSKHIEIFDASRLSHVETSIVLNRSSRECLYETMIHYDIDGEIMSKVTERTKDDIFGFTGDVWNILHTKVKFNHNGDIKTMYKDEYLMCKDSLGVNDNDIIDSYLVGY